MTNKSWEKLNEIDQILRRCFPVEGFKKDRVQVTIKKISGFELFNTRPYHNYEDWADGYYIFLGDGSNEEIFAMGEDLDDAIKDMENKVKIMQEVDKITSKNPDKKHIKHECQWCKEALKLTDENIVILNLDCYEKLLAGYAKSLEDK